MKQASVPTLAEDEMSGWLARAAESPRRRVPKILHLPGAEFNEVVNFVMSDSYMQPHLHPGPEKIEHIHLIRGKMAVIYFDDSGEVHTVTHLDQGESIAVPAFTWHTYVILSDSAVSYETMMGEYDPGTWKNFAVWAPVESSAESKGYLSSLKLAAENV